MSELLRAGDHGEQVRDLQRQLCAAGYDAPASGEFDSATATALLAFQADRGLRADGLCGRESWTALLEASRQLGDRLLYLTRPNLRGDDVGTLQERLNALGFDSGRVDAILGPATELAVREFQRNAGIAVDGVVGPATVEALERLGSLADGSVATVREREEIQRTRRALRDVRVMLAVESGLEALGDAVLKALHATSSGVLLLVGWDESRAAHLANDWEADLFLGLRTASAKGPRCTYFANQTFRSEAGFLLAWSIEDALAAVLGQEEAPAGRTYSALRETRMAAVVCEPARRGDINSMRTLTSHLPDVAAAIATGVKEAIERPDKVRTM